MDAPALYVFSGDEICARPLPVRGVGWVLRWAATLMVLAAAAVILVVFGYQLAAERALARAATAGLREAALPRATNDSVEAVVRRRLAGTLALDRATRIDLTNAGGRRSIGLAVPMDVVLPRWLSLVAGKNIGEITFRSDEPVSNLLGAR